jgi:hypothetical protein
MTTVTYCNTHTNRHECNGGGGGGTAFAAFVAAAVGDAVVVIVVPEQVVMLYCLIKDIEDEREKRMQFQRVMEVMRYYAPLFWVTVMNKFRRSHVLGKFLDQRSPRIFLITIGSDDDYYCPFHWLQRAALRTIVFIMIVHKTDHLS